MNRFIYSITTLFIIALCINCQGIKENKSEENRKNSMIDSKLMFTGTYTKKEGHVDGKADGIGVFQVGEDGSLNHLYTAQDAVNPSFITISSNGEFLYAVNETGSDVGPEASLNAYRIASEGRLELINSQSSHSYAPCHLTVDSQNRMLFLANYVGGVIAVYPLDGDGGIEKASEIIKLEGKSVHARQESSHPHSVTLSPDEKYILVADLGTDRIMKYEVDYQSGKLIPAAVPFIEVNPASGPRHCVFHPSGKYMFVINELSSTITTFEYNEEYGDLRPLQTLTTLPFDYSGENYCADIHMTSNGNFLYGSNRGHDSIAIFSFDLDTGSLSVIGHESTRGEFPRNFMIDGDLLYVANQNTDNVVVFSIQEDGNLAFRSEYSIKTPVCLKTFDYRL